MAPRIIPIEFDVRPMLGRGEEPFAAIMAAFDRLAPGQALRLIAPFRPMPLIALMEERGYRAALRGCGDGVFEVIFMPPTCGPTMTP